MILFFRVLSLYLQIFSERLLTVRSEMQAKDLAMPRGASRAGHSIDSDILTKENAVLCQAIEDTFLAVDEKIQTPESRQALVKIFQDVRFSVLSRFIVTKRIFFWWGRCYCSY